MVSREILSCRKSVSPKFDSHCILYVLGVQKANIWNCVKRREVHEDTLQTEDETVPWHTIVSWRQNRFSTGEGQEIRINLSANYRLVTADISNNGESTTKYYNDIL